MEDTAKTISIVSILENISLPAPNEEFLKQNQEGAAGPLVPLRFFVVHQWARSKTKVGERLASRVRLVGPKGQFALQEYVIDLTASPRARVIGQVIGFPLQGPGVYKCIIEARTKAKWKKFGDTEFTVSYTNPQRKH